MPTATQTRASAFREEAVRTRSAVAQPGSTPAGFLHRARVASPAPTLQPRETPVARPRQQTFQNVVLLLMLLVACMAVGAGLAYLSGYARLTQEGYRRVKLQAQLRQAQELARQWQKTKSLVNTPREIEQRALAAGMIRPDERETVTIR